MTRLISNSGEVLNTGHRTCREICDRHRFCHECPIEDVFKKLMEYEKTGLTPSEIHELIKSKEVTHG